MNRNCVWSKDDWSENLGGMFNLSSKDQEVISDLGNSIEVFCRDKVFFYRSISALSKGRKNTDRYAVLHPSLPELLGDDAFMRCYGLQYAYMAGAMANGINSAAMTIALGQAGFLSSFGSGGLSIERIESAVIKIQESLPNGPYAINLLHNPGNPNWEWQCVDMLLKHRVPVVEASAYINITPALIYYRIQGLEIGPDHSVKKNNRVIAKVSRREVAERFMSPPSDKVLNDLCKQGRITPEQAELAKTVPIADDITVEADSGGHTDHGILTCILPSIAKLRNEIQNKRCYSEPVRIGAGGGIGTPEAVLAAFNMGAAYIVTGSINQACVEAGTSPLVKELLAEAKTTDFMMAPSADMFELGAKVQVLKHKTMFPNRAQKLYALYKAFDSIEAIPEKEIKTLETQYFRKDILSIWQDTVDYFRTNAPDQIKVAEKNPKRKMALIFQWYLGQSSKWAINGEAERMIDFQIWAGPALGACNEWLAGKPAQTPEHRSVVGLAHGLMHEAAFLNRIMQAKTVINSANYSLPPGVEKMQKVNHLKTESCHALPSSTIGQPNTMNMKLDISKSKEYYKKCWDVLPGGTHYNFADPERALIVPFRKGRKSRVWDLDGNEHLDLFCKFGALLTGHHHERYNEALIQYMEKVTSVDICDLEQEVCAMMIAHIPCADMVRFGLSGTEAVQNALRLARGYSGKNRFIRFHGHYHGNADNIIGGRAKKDLQYPIPELFRGDLLDTKGRDTTILENQSFMLPWNDFEVLETTINQYADQIGAVLMEPICINGGGIFASPGYLEKTKELCEKNNIVLIFDEIITGFRLGLGGAQEILGVTPHIATFGKALGGGSMPVSAIVGKKEIMDLYTKGKVIHAGTFNGYPLGLAAIKATIEIIREDEGCYERMGHYMKQISAIFIKAAKENGMPLVVQGMPTALVYHSQNTLVDKAEGYSDQAKFCDVIIREICKRYGIQFSPLSRMYSNLLLNAGDVEFFEARIFDAMVEAKKIIDITFKESTIA